MENLLQHLPEHKQDELNVIRDVIVEKIPDVRMVILFGSYARGNYVDEDIQIESGATHVYESDYDILVVTRTVKQADSYKMQDSINNAIRAREKVSTPISIIYHTFDYVKEMIIEGNYFFCDIQKEGIYLYKANKHNLGKIETIPPEKRKIIAKEYFDQWFKKAIALYNSSQRNFEVNEYKLAAFELHQATESLYSVITLVFINYRFRLHDIEILGHKVIGYDERFAEVFLMDTQEQRDNFTLLKRAYVDARYKEDYEITQEQLEYLAERVKVLMDLTENICKEKIDSFV